MGLITAWLAYTFLKGEVQTAYQQVTADVEELIEEHAYYNQPTTYYKIVDGQIIDVATGEIVDLTQTTEVTEEMEEIAKARHDLTAD